jgi:hypothetical protein
MHRKRITRRQFLKATGAAAGIAFLGQACGPANGAPTAGLEVLLAEVDLKIDGDKVSIPPCCTYTGQYYIDHPPKRPIYAAWAKNFTDVVDQLNDSKTRHMLNTDDNFINAVSDCLGFAADKLFQGDIHSPRKSMSG